MLSSCKFCGNGWLGRSRTQTGAHPGEEANSAPHFLPGSSQPARLLLGTAGQEQEVARGCWPYSGHTEYLGILLRGSQERAGFVGREASASLLLYCSENSFATVQHSDKATGLI